MCVKWKSKQIHTCGYFGFSLDLPKKEKEKLTSKHNILRSSFFKHSLETWWYIFKKKYFVGENGRRDGEESNGNQPIAFGGVESCRCRCSLGQRGSRLCGVNATKHQPALSPARPCNKAHHSAPSEPRRELHRNLLGTQAERYRGWQIGWACRSERGIAFLGLRCYSQRRQEESYVTSTMGRYIIEHWNLMVK